MNDINHKEEIAREKNNIKSTKAAVEWRRDFILQKLSQGWSQSDVARELKLHPSTISLDVAWLRKKSQEELKTHIKETIPFEYKKSRVALQSLIKKTNELLQNNSDDPKLQLSVINTLTNLLLLNSNINSDGNIIQQAYDKVSTLEEIQKRRSDRDPAKITTTDEQDTAPEPEEDIETEEE